MAGPAPHRLHLTLAACALLPVLGACRDSGGGSEAGGGGAAGARPVPQAVPTSRPAGLARVEFVVDGDTIDVSIDGRDERIRLIGVDTPETKIPDQPPECWGPEAADLTEALLPIGTVVRLERDLEPRDDFGRLLAYVIRDADGLVVNVELARQGAAEPLRIRPNVARATQIAAAAADARTAGRGLWGTCPRSWNGAPLASRPWPASPNGSGTGRPTGS
jgi:micrococcal nuclease